jgi:hypothetical protein
MADEIVAKLQTEDTTQEQGNVLGLVLGDVATRTYLLWSATDGAVTAKMALDSTFTDFLESQDNRTYLVDAQIIERDINGLDSGTIRLFGYVKRGVGAATLVVNQISSVPREDAPLLGVSATLTANTTTGSIDINVTGLTGLQIKWAAKVELTETGITMI